MTRMVPFSSMRSRGLVLLALSLACVPVLLRGEARRAPVRDVRGVVVGDATGSRYQRARICADANDDGRCGSGEPTTTTDATGAFVLPKAEGVPLVADISADAAINGHAAAHHLVLRAPADPGARIVVVSPLSSELVRMMEADGVDRAAALRTLASRLGVAPDAVIADPAAIKDARTRASLQRESVILASRFLLATKMADRHDAPIRTAQQAAMTLEGIPRYDHLFIIMLENKATSSIVGSPLAPKINAYLRSGNQFTSYFATGNPSEPNRLAVAAGDDFGITDDAGWNCMPAGDTADAPEDPLPAGLQPCTNATNHNIKNKPNLFSALSAAGMTWRVYSESVTPGRDWRLDGARDETILAPDHVYAAGSPVGAIGTKGLMLRRPMLYVTKHNASVAFQAVRSSPEFARSNRTMGGGQWDAAMKADPRTPAGWDFDQLGTDLASGDVGNLNFLEPDLCDDMHGVLVQAATPANAPARFASDCGTDAIVYRGDAYTDYLIRKIQASPVWTNTNTRTAIVIMFDEGTDTAGFTACCGWNPSAGRMIAGRSLGPLVRNADGSISAESIARYNQGNKGHGTTAFGVLTNQPLAPKHVVDSDAYSHMSFVRTVQDMFGLADPGDDWSYMNRSKYTEKFIAAHLQYLPEYAESADPHFDAVRPMNHAYRIPADYLQKSGFLALHGPQRGPDADQRNAWALKDDAVDSSSR